MIHSSQLTLTQDRRYVGEASDFEDTRHGFPAQLKVIARSGRELIAQRNLVERRDGEITHVEYKINNETGPVTIVLFND